MFDVSFQALASPAIWAAVGFGYLLGSVPFGMIITKLAGTQDLRSIGSGNIGATNVLRTGRKDLAAATLLGDLLKGTIAVLMVHHWGAGISGSGPVSTILPIVAGFGAFIGHLFPVWLGFRGGKGVATYLGVLLGLWWPGALVFAVIWLVTAYATRYSSLSALIAALATPVALVIGGLRAEAVLFSLLTVLIFIKHRENIQRLLTGAEGKIGQKG
jgi:acyl phosphate:glycerol-3-phosphate acyltransferase